MSENVFNIIQLGRQAGTFDAPGSAVAAGMLYPVSESVNPDLDLGGAYPALDRGRNVRNLAGSGYHGPRKAGATIASEVRFEDVLDILEMCYAGDVSPTGSGTYTWVYTFEAGSPSLVPYTIETGNIDSTNAQQRLVSCLINSLQLGFSTVTVGQASPWTLSAEVVAFDREFHAYTESLAARTGLQTVQGHLTRLYEGTTSTAYASLTELSASLKSFTMTANRNLTLRAYGSDSDVPTKFGFSEMSTATYEMVVAVSTSAKTDLHDVWNTSGATLGERRVRVSAAGSSSRAFTVDGLVGMFAVPWDDADGERVFKISGEFADDDTLEASHQITVVNAISALTSGS